MFSKNIIIIAVVVVIVGAAIFYIYRSKKSGKRCIGCPNSVACGKKNNCNCSNSIHKD